VYFGEEEALRGAKEHLLLLIILFFNEYLCTERILKWTNQVFDSPSSDHLDDLSHTIQDFIKQNASVLESIKRQAEEQDKPRETVSPIPWTSSTENSTFQKIDENATLALKKITIKLINVIYNPS
jgi:hypothetical protein